MRNPAGLQPRGERLQVRLIRYGEDDGVGAGRKPSWARLAGGVDDLRCKDSQREVSADDDVVGKRCGRNFNRFSVATSSWTENAHSRRPCQQNPGG
jgi:hypothetical protein